MPRAECYCLPRRLSKRDPAAPGGLSGTEIGDKFGPRLIAENYLVAVLRMVDRESDRTVSKFRDLRVRQAEPDVVHRRRDLFAGELALVVRIDTKLRRFWRIR